jgi:hypothetical protein
MALLKQNIKYHLLLFLISPVLGLVYGIKTKSKRYIRWSIFLFVVIYGSLFNSSFLGDGAVHWENVYQHYVNLDFSIFWERLMDILVLSHGPETNDDPYIHILSYFVGTLIGSPGLFFVFVAIVYAYFYSGVMVKLMSYVNWKSMYNKFYFTFFLVMLVLWIFPLKMQTVRTWTGMWVLLYAILSYHETKKKKYLLLALAPPLIHIGFLALAVPIWFVLFSGFRNPKVYFIVFLVSVVISNTVKQTSFSQFASQTEVGASKVDGYTLDDERTERNASKFAEKVDNTRFYKLFETLNLQTNVLTGIIIFIFIILRQRGFGVIENTLFSYGLAMAAFSNFFTSIFAVHNRGWEIASILILSLMVIFLSKNNLKTMKYSFLKVRLPLFLFVVALIPYTFYLVSGVLSFTSPYVFLIPIVSWIEPEIATNLREIIGIFM